MLNFNPNTIKTPCYVVDEQLLTKNLEILKHVADESGCKILLAQKAFSMFSTYLLIGRFLHGTASSGLHEALLSHNYMPEHSENHVFSAAYTDDELDEVLKICDYVVFNSFSQWKRFKEKAMHAGKRYGIRINPEHSTQGGGIYDPCSPGSRLGVKECHFEADELECISGFHFHTLCEQGSDALIETLAVVEQKFGKYFSKIEWINMGGGHHITKEGYDADALIACIKNFKAKYGLDVYLEPGEAVALNAGFLVATVLDVVGGKPEIAVLDASAACHMPDVLEMPYRPNIVGAGKPGEHQHTYTLAGATCLAGDVIGEYSFAKPLTVGSVLVFEDMAIYSMVKNNTFNGMQLPSIALADKNGKVSIMREFGYEDFAGRLS